MKVLCVLLASQRRYSPIVRELCSRNVHKRTVTWVGGGGGGKRASLLLSPTLLTLPYMLLYICTVHELCSRTVGEYRHRCPLLLISVQTDGTLWPLTLEYG
jgi:hypothetical protein